jgi:hypothetical protein
MSLVITRSMVRLESSGLLGQSTKAIPWRSATSITYGSMASTSLAIFGAIIALVGLAMFSSLAGKVGLLAGVGLALYGLFQRRYVIGVSVSGGPELSIGFRNGLLGGDSVSHDQVIEAGRMLEKLIQRKDDASSPRKANHGWNDEALPVSPNDGTPESSKNPEAVSIRPVAGTSTPAVPTVQGDQPGYPNVFVAEPRPSHVPPISKPPIERPIITTKARPQRAERPLEFVEKSPSPPASENRLDDDAVKAAEAFQAAVRVFESGRASEAEAAWWAIIRRWPETPAARRARKVLSGRRQAARKKTPPRQS